VRPNFARAELKENLVVRMANGLSNAVEFNISHKTCSTIKRQTTQQRKTRGFVKVKLKALDEMRSDIKSSNVAMNRQFSANVVNRNRLSWDLKRFWRPQTLNIQEFTFANTMVHKYLSCVAVAYVFLAMRMREVWKGNFSGARIETEFFEPQLQVQYYEHFTLRRCFRASSKYLHSDEQLSKSQRTTKFDTRCGNWIWSKANLFMMLHIRTH